ncbi:Uncharacterized protein dnm_088060 [Desulfonema magnum]|uniref:Uncharacterized protein n=1 Tax=Desulfonema magnum TaxID=45655 RepID=A0A975BWD5_9BACT|nr:Uncharacterized protein dnm_088060 [Desulfonema magnum]
MRGPVYTVPFRYCQKGELCHTRFVSLLPSPVRNVFLVRLPDNENITDGIANPVRNIARFDGLSERRFCPYPAPAP